MYTSKSEIRGWLLWLTVLLCIITVPNRSFADDDKTSKDSAKPAPVKIDTPAPGLTELESRLLDRLTQREKRIAELESKGNPPAATGAEAQLAQPTEAAAASGAKPESAPVAAGGRRPSQQRHQEPSRSPTPTGRG